MSEVVDLKASANKLMAESIARKIKEKPEDIVWFFAVKSAMEAPLEKGKFDRFKGVLIRRFQRVLVSF